MPFIQSLRLLSHHLFNQHPQAQSIFIYTKINFQYTLFLEAFLNLFDLGKILKIFCSSVASRGIFRFLPAPYLLLAFKNPCVEPLTFSVAIELKFQSGTLINSLHTNIFYLHCLNTKEIYYSYFKPLSYRY